MLQHLTGSSDTDGPHAPDSAPNFRASRLSPYCSTAAAQPQHHVWAGGACRSRVGIDGMAFLLPLAISILSAPTALGLATRLRGGVAPPLHLRWRGGLIEGSGILRGGAGSSPGKGDAGGGVDSNLMGNPEATFTPSAGGSPWSSPVKMAGSGSASLTLVRTQESQPCTHGTV